MSGSRFWVSGWGSQVSGFWFLVSGFWFLVSGLVPGFGFRVSGFGFRFTWPLPPPSRFCSWCCGGWVRVQVFGLGLTL